MAIKSDDVGSDESAASLEKTLSELPDESEIPDETELVADAPDLVGKV